MINILWQNGLMSLMELECILIGTGLGFILMVASAATIAATMRGMRTDRNVSFSVYGWMDDARERWRRER